MVAALTLWGDTSEPLPILQHVCRDKAWIDLLPPGSTVESTQGHGASLWSQAGKINVRLADGTKKAYFIKQTENDIGRLMSQGEYEASKVMEQIIPKSIPRPIGWGTFTSTPDLHFYLAEYIDINDEAFPPKAEICKLVADLHLGSHRISPGRFGFHVNTCNGTIAHCRDWTVSWEEQFTRMLQGYVTMARARIGPSPEVDRLFSVLIEKVVPRLLRPLEVGGRILPATFCSGDLYHGNTARDSHDGSAKIFDPSGLWAHHEFDLHHFYGVSRFLFDRDYMLEYFKHYPPSEPRDEWEDRNELYFLASTFRCSILWPSSKRFRDETVQHMRALIKRFPDGYQGQYKRKGLNDDDNFDVDSKSGERLRVDEKVIDIGRDKHQTASLTTDQALALMTRASTTHIPSS